MTIRVGVPADAAEIARLTVELGYCATADEIGARLERLVDQRKQIVWVAAFPEKLAGWVQAQASEVLESGFRVEIVGLIVSESYRRRGIGRRLVEKAEQWAIELGASTIVVRSNSKRVESHIFFPALGFDASKTQTVYRKLLKNEPNLGSVTEPSRSSDTEVTEKMQARLTSEALGSVFSVAKNNPADR